MIKVTPQQDVLQYLSLSSEGAKRLRGFAEYDDLYQEGCLAIVVALQEDRIPTLEGDILPAQRRWVRFLRKLRGR